MPKKDNMKTMVVPVLDWQAVERMDLGYVRSWWANAYLAAESWSGAVRWFLERADHDPLRRAWRSWFLACAVTYRQEIEALSQAIQLESDVPPLPGIRPGAAAQAAARA